MATEFDNLIMAWKNAQSELASVQTKERDLREAVFKQAFPNAVEGTHNFELGEGWKLKGVAKMNYSIRDREHATVDGVLSEITKTGPDGPFIADRLVKFKPELSVSEYRQLDAPRQALINKVLEIKPALPTLELVPPKDKK